MPLPHSCIQYLHDLLEPQERPAFDQFVQSAELARLIAVFEQSVRNAWGQKGLAAPQLDWRPLEMTNLDDPPVSPSVRSVEIVAVAEPTEQPDSPTPEPAQAPECSVPVPGVGELPQAEGKQDDRPATAPGVVSAPEVKLDPEPAPPPATQANSMPTKIAFKLPNARQGEPYQAQVSVDSANTTVALYDAVIPADSGLAFSREGSRIEGVPTKSGELRIAIRYRLGTDSPLMERGGEVTLYVNPDPRSLWKDLPSDTSDPFWKPDSAHKTVNCEAKRIVAARKRGRSHAHLGTCCDDDFWIDSESGWYVAIVADGAGSAKASRRGSQVAVQAAGIHLRDYCGSEAGAKLEKVAAAYIESGDETARRQLHAELFVAVGHAAHKALQAIHAEVAAWPDRVTGPKDLATTLLIGLARHVAGKWLCAAYWVGDGAVGVYRQGGGIDLLGEVDSGEFSGQTRFLDAPEVTQDAILRRTRFVAVDDFTAFFLMTDGVSDPKFETESRLAQAKAWDELWQDLEAGASLSTRDELVDQRLESWLDFWSAGNHDDRTLAVIY